MNKFFVGLMAFVAMSLAQASVPIFQPSDGEGAGWAHIHEQLVGAKAIKDGRIEVPVLGDYAFQILKETKRINELHPDHRSEQAAVTLMEGILGGKEIATEDFQKRLLAGGLDFPDAAETERLRTATALDEIERLQKTLQDELNRLTNEKSEAATRQRTEIEKLQGEVSSLKQNLETQAQAASTFKKRVEDKAATHATNLTNELKTAKSELETRVQDAVVQTARITGRLETVEKAPIVKYGNTVLWLVGAALLGLLGLAAFGFWLKRETGEARRIADEAVELPAATLKMAQEAHGQISRAALAAQNAEGAAAKAREVADGAVKKTDAVAKEVIGVKEELKDVHAKQRDIDIPANLEEQLRKLTADELRHQATIIIDDQEFLLSFVFAEDGKVFIRGIKDQENAVAIDNVRRTIRRAGGARISRVLGWEAMQQREPTPIKTARREPVLQRVPGSDVISRAAERERQRSQGPTGVMPDIRTG